MASFSCILTLDGQEFPVVHCAYEFNQTIGPRGRTITKVRSGLLTLHLDVPDGDKILAWAVDPRKKLNGELVFHEINLQVARERLAFEEGFLVSYEEVFAPEPSPKVLTAAFYKYPQPS